MSTGDYEHAVRLMAGAPRMQSFAGRRPAQLVDAAESALGLTFPPLYRRFLLEYGAGSFGSAEIYGVIDADFANSGIPDAVWCTLVERNNASLPTNLVAIYNDGAGNLGCIEAQAVPSLEGRIIEWQPGHPKESQPLAQLASDFGAFLLALVQRQIGSK